MEKNLSELETDAKWMRTAQDREWQRITEEANAVHGLYELS